MDAIAQRHRTFEPFNPALIVGRNECDVRCHRPRRRRPGGPSFAALPDFVAESAAPSDPLAQHLARLNGLSRPGPSRRRFYKPHQRTFAATQLVGRKFREVRMIESEDQDFLSYATPWERRFSLLVSGRGRIRATPVVDDSYLVIGHLVTVSDRRLWIPEGVFPGLRLLLEDGVPVYVDTEPMQGWRPLLTSGEEFYTVLVAIDGEVLAVLDHSSLGLESVDFWLLDVITVGGMVANLGRVALRKAVRALGRRAAKGSATRSLTGRSVRRAREAVRNYASRAVGSRSYLSATGMPRGHFRAMQEAAHETGMIAVVRNTNVKSIPLINRGCPAKPLAIKANTSPRTGVVTVKSPAEAQAAYREGYFVVDADLVARRTVMKGGKAVTEELPLGNTFWQLERGQIIQGGATPKPLTGDYDLMGVVDPQATGRNLALVAKNGKAVADVSGPNVTRFRQAVNAKLDQPRVMHGAQDQFADFRGGATAFFPDGRVRFLQDEAEVKAFYRSLGRQTRKRRYPRPGPWPAVPVDELAARRGRRR